MPKATKPTPVPGLKGITKRLADGTVKTFFYDRRTRLALGTDRAAAIRRLAEIDAMNGPELLRRRQAGSIAALIAEFKASPEHTGLADSTKALWRPFLTDLEERVGDWAPKMFSLKLASKFKANLIKEHGSGSARNRFKAYSRLWNWGRANGLVDSENPFERPGSFTKSNKKPGKKPIWRMPEVKAFLGASRDRNLGGNPTLLKERVTEVEYVPDDVRLAFLLGLFTLQRQGDVLSMTGQMLFKDKGGRLWMDLSQLKTGTDVQFPLVSLLVEELERQKIEPGSPRYLVQTMSGKKFGKRNFGRKFSAWLDAAGLTKLNFQALRRSGMVWLAEDGVTEARIAALSGHNIERTRAILEVYIVKTAGLAAGAVEGFERIVRANAFPSASGHTRDPRK
jgi:integrase